MQSLWELRDDIRIYVPGDGKLWAVDRDKLTDGKVAVERGKVVLYSRPA